MRRPCQLRRTVRRGGGGRNSKFKSERLANGEEGQVKGLYQPGESLSLSVRRPVNLPPNSVTWLSVKCPKKNPTLLFNQQNILKDGSLKVAEHAAQVHDFQVLVPVSNHSDQVISVNRSHVLQARVYKRCQLDIATLLVDPNGNVVSPGTGTVPANEHTGKLNETTGLQSGKKSIKDVESAVQQLCVVANKSGVSIGRGRRKAADGRGEVLRSNQGQFEVDGSKQEQVRKAPSVCRSKCRSTGRISNLQTSRKLSGQDNGYPDKPGDGTKVTRSSAKVNFGAGDDASDAPAVAPAAESADSADSPPNPDEKVPEIKMSRSKEFHNLWKELKLDQNEILAKHPQVKERVKQIIYKYRHVFSQDGEIGETDLTEMKLKIKPNVEPIRQKVRDFNPAMTADLNKTIDQWMAQGVIEKSDSPWSSALVPVKKKDGTVRWCVDYRSLNKCIEGDSFPLPKIQGLLDRAGGHKFYSILDATSAYFHIRINPSSRKYTAFSTPTGLYQFTRVPFGLQTAPAVYSRFIAAALNKLGTAGLNVYLDDVLLFSNKLWEHVEHLEKVLEAHAEAGIKLKPSKTSLFQSSVNYLGHLLSEDGISMIPEYVENIVNWPIPKTVKQLNSLLGFFSYYRAFIPEFSKLTTEMNSQRRSKVLKWTPLMTEKLEKLKSLFLEHPIRSVPRFDDPAPFELTTDFSSAALGAVLSQRQGGAERLIAAAGRKTTTAEGNYPAWKGELAAVIYGLRKFHSILSYRRFVLNTDSSVMQSLHNLRPAVKIVSRWLTELSGYTFDVKHRPGRLNTNADALSRSDHLPEATADDLQDDQDYLEGMTEEELIQGLQELEANDEQIVLLDHILEGERDDILSPMTSTDFDLDRQVIFKAQVDDPILREVRNWLAAGKPPGKDELRGKSRDLQTYRNLFESFKLDNDGVLSQHVETFLGTQNRILVPDSLKFRIFQWGHESAMAGHFGQNATVSRLKRNFYYPGMYTDILNRVNVCHSCLAKVTSARLKSGIHVPQCSSYPMQTLNVDLVGPLPTTKSGFKYIMSVQDGFSRFIQLFPLKSKETSEVVKTLLERVISVFGCPLTVHSDQGKEFTSNLMKELLKALQIKQTFTPPYNPNSNPVERFHRTLAGMMRTILDREDKDWSKALPSITLAYNSKVNSSTGVTPSLAFTGREIKIPVDLVVGVPHQEVRSVHEHVRVMLDRYHRIFQHVTTTQAGVIRRNAKQYAGDEAQYAVGDPVWYLSARLVPDKPRKLTNSWTGPWEVVSKVTPVIYKIKGTSVNGQKAFQTDAHIGRLRPCHNPGRSNIPEDIDQHVPDDEFSESIAPPTKFIPVHVDREVIQDSQHTHIPIHPTATATAQPTTSTHVTHDTHNTQGLPPTRAKTPQSRQPDVLEEPVHAGQPLDIQDAVQDPEVQDEGMQVEPFQVPEDVAGGGGRVPDRRGGNFQVPDIDRGGEVAHHAQAQNRRGEVRPRPGDLRAPGQPDQRRPRLDLRGVVRSHSPSTDSASTHTPAQAPQAKPVASKQRKKIRTRAADVIKEARKLSKAAFSSDSSDVDMDLSQLFVHVKRGSQMPVRATAQAAGYDLAAVENVTLPPRTITAVPTGLAVQLPPDTFLSLQSRSGLARNGIITVAGVIDPDYRGEISCLLFNTTNKPFEITSGLRITQAIFLPLSAAEFVVKDELTATDRGAGGFGHTDLTGQPH